MTELERTKEALSVVMDRYVRVGEMADAQNSVAAILSPPPEMETVEVVKWYVASQPEYSRYFEHVDFDLAKRCCVLGEEPVRRTGTYLRPKPQKVERSVNVTFCDNGAHGYIASEDVKGKAGTFTYTE